MERGEIREKIFDLSCGVVATAIDLVLFSFLYGGELLTAGYSSPGVAWAADKAFWQLESLAIDKEVIKRAIGTLQEFIQEKKLSGTIIVSDIGKDGSIGEVKKPILSIGKNVNFPN